MPALGFTYTQGRPCPSLAIVHFRCRTRRSRPARRPRPWRRWSPPWRPEPLNAAGCVESAFELEGTLPLSFFFRSCTVRPEAVLSAASLTLPVVLDLAGWTVFSLPY